jgi:hypothetical protein
MAGLPYVTFFLVVNIGRLPLPSFAHRVSFMFLSFGQGIAMVLTLIYTDDVIKILFNILTKIFPCIRNTRIETINTIDVPMPFHGTMTA